MWVRARIRGTGRIVVKVKVKVKVTGKPTDLVGLGLRVGSRGAPSVVPRGGTQQGAEIRRLEARALSQAIQSEFSPRGV